MLGSLEVMKSRSLEGEIVSLRS